MFSNNWRRCEVALLLLCPPVWMWSGACSIGIRVFLPLGSVRRTTLPEEHFS